jgi:tetratricopeptide (TPR) repeat protein
MFSIKFRWLFVGMLCLALWPAQALTQQSTWEQHMLAGNTAYRQGKYKEAEKLWKAGLEAAESFGTQDPRYATSLNNLALLYQTQGRYADAEPFHKHALRSREKALGTDHPDVAQSLNNLAELYRAQARYGDAEPLHKRSLGI